MIIVTHALGAPVALAHAYILVLEMFLWTTPRGQRAFGLTPAFAEQITSSRRILFVQTVPAALALLFVLL